MLLSSGISVLANGDIQKTRNPVVIDGKLDEPCWKNAAVVPVHFRYSGKRAMSEEPRMFARYAWDERYFYIGYEVFDRNLTTVSRGPKQGPPGNQRMGGEWGHPTVKVDVVEFFITFGDARFFWEIHHNAANEFNDIWCSVLKPSWFAAKSSLALGDILFAHEEYVKDDGEFTLKTAVQLLPRRDGKPSTVNDPSDEDTGYSGEIRLPLAGIGVPVRARVFRPGADGKPEANGWNLSKQKARILAVYQNGDLQEHYHHSSSTRPPGNWFHKTVRYFPEYRFVP